MAQKKYKDIREIIDISDDISCGLKLQDLKNKVNDWIKKCGANAFVNIDTEVSYGCYNDSYGELVATISWDRKETEQERLKRLDYNRKNNARLKKKREADKLRKKENDIALLKKLKEKYPDEI